MQPCNVRESILRQASALPEQTQGDAKGAQFVD